LRFILHNSVTEVNNLLPAMTNHAEKAA